VKKLWILIALAMLGCTYYMLTKQETQEVIAVLKQPYRQFSQYPKDILSKPLIERVQPVSENLLSYLKALDNMPSYANYTPSPSEMKEISNYIEMLPPLHQKIMKERMLGIYFVDTFMGGGMTDIAADEAGKEYFYIIFNPATLKSPFGKWVSQKDMTCFIPDNSGYTVEIETGTGYNGFFYILLHEVTHGIDYVENITPYADDFQWKMMVFFSKMPKQMTPFVTGIWDGLKLPLPDNDYQMRKQVSVYGWGGPNIKLAKAEKLYRNFSASPFVTLYGSTSWAEDLAEFATYYHITQVLGKPYVITVKSNGNPVFVYEPMKSAKVMERFGMMKVFYQ